MIIKLYSEFQKNWVEETADNRILFNEPLHMKLWISSCNVKLHAKFQAKLFTFRRIKQADPDTQPAVTVQSVTKIKPILSHEKYNNNLQAVHV